MLKALRRNSCGQAWSGIPVSSMPYTTCRRVKDHYVLANMIVAVHFCWRLRSSLFSAHSLQNRVKKISFWLLNRLDFLLSHLLGDDTLCRKRTKCQRGHVEPSRIHTSDFCRHGLRTDCCISCGALPYPHPLHFSHCRITLEMEFSADSCL